MKCRNLYELIIKLPLFANSQLSGAIFNSLSRTLYVIVYPDLSVYQKMAEPALEKPGQNASSATEAKKPQT